MPIQVNLVTATGVTATYHVVTLTTLNPIVDSGVTAVSSFLNSAAFSGGKLPLQQGGYNLGTVTALVANNADIRVATYNKLLTLPDFTGGTIVA